MRIAIQTILYVGIILSLGCNSTNNWEFVHPVSSYLPSDSLLAFKIDVSSDVDVGFEEFNELDSYEFVVTIGSENSISDDDYYYNIPQKIAIDENQRIYITQEHLNSIAVYDNRGKYLYRIGNNGRGPGEFNNLKSFSFSEDFSKLYVLDTFEIDVFQRIDSKYEYERTIQTELYGADNICIKDSEIITNGFISISESEANAPTHGSSEMMKNKVSNPITILDIKKGVIIKAFGCQYPTYSGYGFYSGNLSKVMIVCSNQNNTIVGIQKDFSYIFGYKSSGERKWVSKLEGFENAKHKEFKNPENPIPGLIPYVNSDYFALKLPLANIQLPNYALLQYKFVGPQPYFKDHSAKESNRGIQSVLINTINGSLQSSSIYDHIGAWENGLMIIVDTNQQTFQRIFHIYEKL